MKLKNIQLSLAVFSCLVIFSFSVYASAQQNANSAGNIFLDSDGDSLTDQEEALYGTDPRKADTDGDGYSDGAEVTSGYDPTKPAPGDKLATAPVSEKNAGTVLGEESDGNNLTNQVAEKLTEIVETAQSNPESSDITIAQLQEIIDQTLSASETSQDESLPEVKKEDLKILEQNYDSLSEEAAKEKKKNDFLNYMVAVAYIMASNSPEPITSNQDISNVVTTVYKTATSAIESRSAEELADLEKSNEKIVEQLKAVEVPEEMADTHIKSIRYALYAQEMSAGLSPNVNDPLKDIANFSKMQTFVESLQEFTTDIQAKFTEYGITYDEDIKNRLKSYGLDGIVIDETTAETSDTSVGVGTTATSN